jgi:hypothetical protein
VATSLARGWSGRIYVAGATGSADFPQYHPIQLVQGASLRLFVTEVTFPTLGQPQVVSATPSSGSGPGDTFTFRFRHPDGVQSIYFIHWMFNNPFGGKNACYGAYIQGNNVLQLTTDGESGWPSIQLGTQQTLSNSQCTIYAEGSSAVESGTDLVLTLRVAFPPGFAGTRKIWLHVVDRLWRDSGFVLSGTYNVAVSGGIEAGPIPPASVTPASGSGSGGTFNFTYPIPAVAADADTLYALFNSSPNAARGCLVAWQRAANLLYLGTDDGSGWLPSLRPGTADSAANSMCSVSAAGFRADRSSGAWVIQATIVFKDGATGALPIYARGIFTGGLDSGYERVGMYQVAVRHVPMVVSVAPDSGSGTAQTFSLRFRHPDGIASLYYVHLLINNPFGGGKACYAAYIQGAGILQLASDNEALWPSLALGSNQTLSNSQCTISATGSSAVESGTELFLNIVVTFKPAFAGQRKIWLHAVDRKGQDSGYLEKGFFDVALGGG